MALQFQKRKTLTKGTRANISKSGVSLSHTKGPLTVSSRGRASIRLAPGFSWRLGKGQAGPVAAVMLAVSLVLLVAWLCWLLVKLTWLSVWLPTRWLVGRFAARNAESAPPPGEG